MLLEELLDHLRRLPETARVVVRVETTADDSDEYDLDLRPRRGPDHARRASSGADNAWR